jgi:hypothetical protein
MQAKGTWQHLWLKKHLCNRHKILKPHASYVLTIDELNTFLSRMGSMKVPTYYGTSLAEHVVNKKLGSMKSHDYHMLMQQVCVRTYGSGAIDGHCDVYSCLPVSLFEGLEPL